MTISRCLLLAFLLTACAAAPPAPGTGSGPHDEMLYLIVGGWHTEVALPRAGVPDLPPPLAAEFAGARYLVFGWGERGYYMAANPGIGDVLRALVPGPAVTLVVPLGVPPADAYGAQNVLALPVSHVGLAHAAAFLGGSIAEDHGNLLRAGAGPEPGSVFFESTGSYDIAHTCNTWTAEALAAAGLPVDPAGVVFADQVVRAARPLAQIDARPAAR